VAELPPGTGRLQTRGGILEYSVSGAGRPVIVLFNGAGISLESWQALHPAVEELGTVFAWNRYGLPGSDEPHRELTGAVVIASLRELLHYAALLPPYVLVGHSLGGLYANLFARMHPDEVGAVLLLEATHPEDPESHEGNEDQIARTLSKMFSQPEDSFRHNLQAELEAVADVAREIASAGPFPDVPLVVVTGVMEPPETLVTPYALAVRRANQRELARLSSQGKQIVAEQSGHFPQVSEPQVVVDALRTLLSSSASPAAKADGGACGL
jgi:pimeloyl-ACP methyl ester carboxylesterase